MNQKLKKYTLFADDYTDAIYMLRRLRKRKVKLDAVIVLVSVDHWNKVKDFLNKNKDEFRRPMVVVINV